MLRSIILCLAAGTCGAARNYEGLVELEVASGSNVALAETNETESHAVWRALSRLTHDSHHISQHIMAHPIATMNALQPLGHVAFLQVMAKLNFTTLAPVPPSDQKDKLKLPPKTIPLVKNVPLIPEEAQHVLKECCQVKVDYSYYYDPDTDTLRYATKEDLQNAIDLTKPKTPQQLAWELAVSLLPMVLVAFCYKSMVSDKRPPLAEIEQLGPVGLNGGDFKSGMFDCFQDTAVCCHACCCPAMRVADTISKTGLMGFWTVVFLYVVVDASAQLLGLLVSWKDSARLVEFVRGVAFVAVFVPWRQGVRLRLGGGQPQTWTQVTDILGWFCCHCCVMAQEARELDRVNGVQVSCLCSLSAKAQTLPLVGEPAPMATAAPVADAVPT